MARLLLIAIVVALVVVAVAGALAELARGRRPPLLAGPAVARV